MKDSNPFFVSKRNKQGILFLVVLAMAIVFTPRVLLLIQPKEKFNVTSSDIIELKESNAASLLKAQTKFNKQNRYKKPIAKFDPNTYSEKEWIALGLSKKQTSVVLKFTQRGIYSNEQLKKIFVIPAELYDLIKDSTVYPAQKEYKAEIKKAEKTIVLIELNKADQETLESIPGIGTFYAKNILKYRDRLGGFLYKEQLMEVWKMDIEKYNAIEKYIQVDPQNIKRIELNTVTAEELKEHPYMNWSSANSIVKIRTQKVKFKSINDIKESVLIDEELFEKVKPYLTL